MWLVWVSNRLQIRYLFRFTTVLFLVLTVSCGGSTRSSNLDDIAESYVRLVLAMEKHDPGYVDAYYGPAEWKTEVEAVGLSLERIGSSTTALLEELSTRPIPDDTSLVALRHLYLLKQLRALSARIEMLQGKQMSFDEESAALYDAVAPHHTVEEFQGILDELNRLLPGKSPLYERVQAFRSEFEIPAEKLDTVFTAAIEECRRRTARHIALPESESFRVEYVTDKPWGGYNWYQGNLHSLIEINTDLPSRIDRAIELAGHEGYPGHHVYNSLLEERLYRDRGWVEYSVYALYSPQSLLAEGTANYGVEILFTPAERMSFEQEVLFPLAGLNPARAEKYYAVQALLDKLAYAGNEAARGYLNGEMTRQETIDWLMKYKLSSEKRAQQRTRFYDTYRSYVINYNYGEDLVRIYVESTAGAGDDTERRWEVFAGLLGSPTMPSQHGRVSGGN